MHLKTIDAHNLGIQTFDVWPKSLNVFSTMINITVYFWYIRNNFPLPATWQQEKHYILKAEQGCLDGMYTEVLNAKFVHYHHSHKNKGFWKKEG